MKKTLRTMMCLIVMALTMTSLTSCEDEYIASELEGIWSGEVAQEVFSNRYGARMEYYRIEMEFYSNPFSMTKGKGVEYDYTSNYRYTKTFFHYNVDKGVIYIDYDDGTHVAIYNKHLRNGHFIGDFHDYITGEYLASFDLVKVADNDCNIDHGYGYGYYAKDAQFEEIDAEEAKVKTTTFVEED